MALKHVKQSFFILLGNTTLLNIFLGDLAQYLNISYMLCTLMVVPAIYDS